MATERRAVLVVAGSVDVSGAGDLDALLNALMDRGYGQVVLDLTGARFLDAQGPGLVADGLARLRARGHLAVAAPSAILAQLTSPAPGRHTQAGSQPLGTCPGEERGLPSKVSQAQGVIMACQHVSADEALALLRHVAASASVSLGDVASTVVASTQPGLLSGVREN